MQPRSANSEIPPELLQEQLGALMDSGLPVDDKLRHLALLRTAAPPEDIDRCLLERYGQLNGGLQIARQKQEELGEMLEKFTAPPYFPAIFQNTVDTENGPSAIVRLGTELRVVALGDAVEADELTPGDEVLLASERNVVIARSGTSCFDCGELATFSASCPAAVA